jgi:hypothetical protein
VVHVRPVPGCRMVLYLARGMKERTAAVSQQLLPTRVAVRLAARTQPALIEVICGVPLSLPRDQCPDVPQLSPDQFLPYP